MKNILQLDWIFLSLCAKFQLQIIFFEGFRGGASWDLVVSPPARASMTLIAL